MDHSSSSQLQTFCEQLPLEVRAVLSTLFKYQLQVLFVGGSVRYFLTHGRPAHDLDGELRPGPISCATLDEWYELLNLFKAEIQHQGITLDEAGVGVFKVRLGEYDLELSTPRQEIFRAGEWGHSNFDALFDPKLSYEKAFLRRDFTINAIGLLFKSFTDVTLIDPYEGRADLAQKVLRPISENFHRDPVRILRALRFELALGFKRSEELDRQLERANLSELTNHYLAHEARKVGIIRFMASFYEEYHRFGWEIPTPLKELAHLDWHSLGGATHRQALDIFILLFCAGATQAEVMIFAHAFGLKQKELKRAHSLTQELAQGISAAEVKLHKTVQNLTEFKQYFLAPPQNPLALRLFQLLD